MRSAGLKALMLAALVAAAASAAPAQTPGPVRYGANPAAARTFVHDGVKLYYETYGQGPPLLIIHGNGGSIGSLRAQIDGFRGKYRVIVMDSRDQGRSGAAPGPLTFEAMADDLAALLDREHAGPAYVLGWSDGGIEALLLAQRHPQQVKMIAVMAANLEPSAAAINSQFISPSPAPERVKAILEGGDETAIRRYRTDQLDRDEPHIDPKSLAAIQTPALILAGDHDIIRDEHTLEIFHHLPNSQLAIFPNATHMIPYDDPATFNATVERFFAAPFVKRDRLIDVLKSLSKMVAEAKAN
jgi:pimeloyl-ACP methyl ester carboxylesterase